MWVPVVNTEGNIDAGKTILLNKFKQSLSSEDKITIKEWNEPIKKFWGFYGNDLINPLEDFYTNPTHNAFIFKTYVLDVYQQRMEILETVQHPCKIIVMDCGFDACQIFTTVNKDQYTKFGFLYLTEKYLWLKLKFFWGKPFATSGVLSKLWSLRGNEIHSIS